MEEHLGVRLTSWGWVRLTNLQPFLRSPLCCFSSLLQAHTLLIHHSDPPCPLEERVYAKKAHCWEWAGITAVWKAEWTGEAVRGYGQRWQAGEGGTWGTRYPQGEPRGAEVGSGKVGGGEEGSLGEGPSLRQQRCCMSTRISCPRSSSASSSKGYN